MGRVVSWIFMVIVLAIAYMSYRNSRPDPGLQAQAQAEVCRGREECTLAFPAPSVVRTTIVGQDFQWTTLKGPVTVKCARDMVFLGPWRCAAEDGRLLSGS